MTESEIYGGGWGTDEMREIFDDEPRTRAWCRLIGVLAEAQAEVGIIPESAAEEISRVCEDPSLPMDRLREGYRRTGHSTLGLIRLLKKQCQGDAGEWLYYGATVQDITDTWLMGALNRVSGIVKRDGSALLDSLLELAREHRDTLMVGRTHGQAGSPITFGFKAAVWADETHRHLQRLRGMESRLSVGQLAGAVGGLTAYGEEGEPLREAFFRRLDLSAPDIAWINARDRIAEFLQLLATIASTIEKIGQEVYNLQRPEIGELREGQPPGVVGSITMPHKRNPERSEHLGTLARLVRSHADTMTRSLVHDHERDGRSWKIEWEAVPAACLAAGAVLRLGRELIDQLQVHPEAMARNLEARGGLVYSETLMLQLARHVGKQSAHEIVHDIAMDSQTSGEDFRRAVGSDPRIREHLSDQDLESVFGGDVGLPQVQRAVDRILERHDAS